MYTKGIVCSTEALTCMPWSEDPCSCFSGGTDLAFVLLWFTLYFYSDSFIQISNFKGPEHKHVHAYFVFGNKLWWRILHRTVYFMWECRLLLKMYLLHCSKSVKSVLWTAILFYFQSIFLTLSLSLSFLATASKVSLGENKNLRRKI